MAQGKRTVSDEEILRAIRSQEDPFVTAGEVAELFGMTRQWAHNRLQDLNDGDRIHRKKSGPRNVIWWIEN
ncbi:HTH domain-containing protein [Halosimplex rubrum]|uniref:HTH domain-containing protein n=1 Tax=Halosimplex rubrum TaxID=869889 RepID=A0A7D5T3H9_9EURY|nr:HTH domain-containing protein [Halosimplex rubrum]QLH76930.1 HTH domain-containing protein [Halosimplex rubrum]